MVSRYDRKKMIFFQTRREELFRKWYELKKRNSERLLKSVINNKRGKNGEQGIRNNTVKKYETNAKVLIPKVKYLGFLFDTNISLFVTSIFLYYKQFLSQLY